MAKEIQNTDLAQLVKDYNLLAKQMLATIERQNSMIETLNNRVNELAENERQELLSQKAFAKKIGKDYASIHRELEKGNFDTPEGYDKPAVELCGHGNSAMIWYPLGLKYMTINKKAKREKNAA